MKNEDLRHFDADAFQIIPSEVAGGLLAWGLLILLIVMGI